MRFYFVFTGTLFQIHIHNISHCEPPVHLLGQNMLQEYVQYPFMRDLQVTSITLDMLNFDTSPHPLFVLRRYTTKINTVHAYLQIITGQDEKHFSCLQQGITMHLRCLLIRTISLF